MKVSKLAFVGMPLVKKLLTKTHKNSTESFNSYVHVVTDTLNKQFSFEKKIVL